MPFVSFCQSRSTGRFLAQLRAPRPSLLALRPSHALRLRLRGAPNSACWRGSSRRSRVLEWTPTSRTIARTAPGPVSSAPSQRAGARVVVPHVPQDALAGTVLALKGASAQRLSRVSVDHVSARRQPGVVRVQRVVARDRPAKASPPARLP